MLRHAALWLLQPQGQGKTGEGHAAEMEAQAATTQIRMLLGQCRTPPEVAIVLMMQLTSCLCQMVPSGKYHARVRCKVVAVIAR